MCSDNIPSVYFFFKSKTVYNNCIYLKIFGNYFSIHRYIVHLSVHLHNMYFIPVYGNIAFKNVCAK